jgi:hypothetical protein
VARGRDAAIKDVGEGCTSLRGCAHQAISTPIKSAHESIAPWLRPREPIGEARFVCQVRIEQDPAGCVAEVTLERCNGVPLVSSVTASSAAHGLSIRPKDFDSDAVKLRQL